MTISEIFHELKRREHVASKAEFATRYLHRSANYLSLCEGRAREPSCATLVRLARALCAPDLRDLQIMVVQALLGEDARCP